MSFYDFQHHSDIIVSEIFEGIKQNVDWAEEQIKDIDITNVGALLNPFSDHARQLMITRQLQKPLSDIKTLTSGSAEEKASIPRYRMYSAHDTNIANILRVLDADLDIPLIHYAANIYFELHSENGESYVRTMYDGEPMKLGKCEGEEYCQIDKFFDLMKSVLY